MVNAKDIVAGKKDSELGVKVADANTLVSWIRNSGSILVMMMATTVKPVHKATAEKYGWTTGSSQITLLVMAFAVDKWVVNERLVLKRNDQYWNNDKTVLNKVTFLPIENQVVEMNRFLSGEIDFTNELQ